MSFISTPYDVKMCKFEDVQISGRLIFSLMFAAIIAFSACNTAGYVAIVTNEGDMTGACYAYNVYQLYDKREGQVQAVPPITLDSITKQVLSSCAFIKSHPEYKGKVAIHCYISCKGELFKCVSWGRWGDPILREEVTAVFGGLKTWTPGKLNGEIVDCVEDFTVDVDHGMVSVSSANIY